MKKGERVLGKKELEAIRKIYDYLDKDERRHFETCNPEDKKIHIYNSVKVLRSLVQDR